MSESIRFSYKINGDGSGIRIDGNDIAETIKSKTLGWVHLNAQHNNARNWLHDNIPYLDEGILDSLLADETRPRITEINNGLLVILRGMNLNKDAAPEDMVSIRMWIDPERIITTSRRELKAVQDMRDILENGKGPVNAADFIFDLTTFLFKRMEPTLLELDERTDNIEEEILENQNTTERQEIIDIRKKAIIFRRYIAPQKDAMAYLRNTEISWLDQKHKRQLQENLDRLTRYVEDLDAIRERSQIIKDEMANALADKMNKNMYMLSIVAAIFLPLGFITGLLGINVGGMPGVNNDYAFWITCGACAFFIILMIAIFKKLKWV